MTPRLIRLIASAAVAAMAILAVPAGPASAGAPPSGTQKGEPAVVYEERPSGKGVSLQAADCPADNICLYDGTNYGYPRLRIHVSVLYDCAMLDLSPTFHDRTESTHNNTRFAFDLLNHRAGATGHGSDILAGRAAAHRAYTSHLQHNNTIDHVVSPGCW
ncbi:peptidase inhibitor family I36 protein [Nonomuraea candida]|uniref:peptidase inhibitor family I36 protein n=1 Tax=Nonomuraea candida TaxID=359159 RepID=UPI0005BB7578|nr:peptidase inhibitor family I36 protein [Nonomuraea candida]